MKKISPILALVVLALTSPLQAQNIEAGPGFAIKSNSGDFSLRFRTLVNVDSRTFLTDTDKNASAYLVRSARPSLEGVAYKIVQFRLVPDFGNGATVLQDAYIETQFSPQFKLRTGKFKVSVGLERLQARSDVRFAERGFPTSFLPNRDSGIQVSGETDTLQYAVGIFNGQSDNVTTDGDTGAGKDLAFRLFITPFKNGITPDLEGLGFGFGYDTGDQTGGTSSSYKSLGQRTMFSYTGGVTTGTRYHFSPQISYYNGPFGFFGEWAQSSQVLQLGGTSNRITHNAWQLHGEWILTGENASFKALKIKTPYDPTKGTWGALELVGRINQANFDSAAFDSGFASASTSVKRATAVGVGLNWYLNPALHYSIAYEHTVFEGGSTGSSNRNDEKLLTLSTHLSL
ncbi:MAG: OprO/OprP family phosphate-selective porin [Candidatus Margulisiibacteriota bacterium]